MKKPTNVRDAIRKLSDSELFVLLDSPDRELERRICFEIGRRRLKAGVEPLLKRLRSDDPRVRETAAEALGMIGDASAGAGILELFSEEKQPTPVRDTCAYALSRLAYRPALKTLLSGLLVDPSPSVRLCIVAALAEIGGAEIRDSLEMARGTEQNLKVHEAIGTVLRTFSKRKEHYRDIHKRAVHWWVSDSGTRTQTLLGVSKGIVAGKFLLRPSSPLAAFGKTFKTEPMWSSSAVLEQVAIGVWFPEPLDSVTLRKRIPGPDTQEPPERPSHTPQLEADDKGAQVSRGQP